MSHLILIQTSKVGQTNFILLPFSLLPRGSQSFHPFSWRAPSNSF